MSTDPELKRKLSDFYAGEGAIRAPDRVLESSIAAIDTTPQRRALTSALLRPVTNPRARLIAAAVVVVAVGAIGLATFRPGGAPGVGGAPAPTVTAHPSYRPISAADGVAGHGGRYRLDAGFPVDISVEVPDGWSVCSMGPHEQGICAPGQARSAAVSFLIVENVVADPCAEALQSPAVGPSVDGYLGRAFEVQAPATDTCGFLTWATDSRTNGVGAGERNVIRIVDVDGTRVFIAGAYFPGSNPPSDRATIDAIIASVQIGR